MPGELTRSPLATVTRMPPMRDEDEVGARGGILDDEIVTGARVKEYEERGATNGDAELHGLTRANVGESEHRDDQLAGGLIRGVVVGRVVEVDEEEVLANPIVPTPEFFVAVEAETEATAFFHLRLGEAFNLPSLKLCRGRR